MAGQPLPDPASQLSPSTAPALSSALQQHSSAPTSSASGGSGSASSLASAVMPANGGMSSTTSSSQAISASGSAPNTPQQNVQIPQHNLSNPSNQTSMLSQMNLQSYQQSLQNKPANGLSHMQSQMIGQTSGGQSSGTNSLAQQMAQQQGRQPQYSQNAQTSSLPQQSTSLQQHAIPTSQSQSLQNIPRVSSAQRLLQMQQPGGGVAGMRTPLSGGTHFNQQLSPSLSASLSVGSPGAVQSSSSSTSLQQQQQILGQRAFQGQQQQTGTPIQQRAPQATHQGGQIAQQNQQHTSQNAQVQSPNQTLAQQVHSSSRTSLFPSSQQSVGSHLGHHLQQPGVASRLGTTGGGAMQGQGPGLPSLLPVPSAQPFPGMQSQTQQALQGLSTMAMMGSAGHSASSSLPSQLARAATPLMAQQQRIQQQSARLQQHQTQQQQQQSHQPPLQQQPQQQATMPSPSKQQSSQQLPRLPSVGSSGSQMQSIAVAAQQNAALIPPNQSWFSAGQLKPNLNASVSYHSQLPQQQLQSSQQRSQQPQQQSAASTAGPLQLQLQQSQQVGSQQQPSAPPIAGLAPASSGVASTPIPPTPQTPMAAPIPTQALLQQQQRAQSSASQRSSTPAGQQLSSVQPVTSTTGPGSQASDSSGKILGKRSIQDLVSQVDPGGKLDPDVEDVILEIADDFVETVTSFACALAKHRKSTTLEVKDVLLHLERNWHMTIPGFSGDDYRAYKKPSVSETHKHRLALVRKSLASVPTQEAKPAPVPTAERANSGPQPAKPSQPPGPVTSPRLNVMH